LQSQELHQTQLHKFRYQATSVQSSRHELHSSRVSLKMWQAQSPLPSKQWPRSQLASNMHSGYGVPKRSAVEQTIMGTAYPYVRAGFVKQTCCVCSKPTNMHNAMDTTAQGVCTCRVGSSQNPTSILRCLHKPCKAKALAVLLHHQRLPTST
jgi:hypothetical protein